MGDALFTNRPFPQRSLMPSEETALARRRHSSEISRARHEFIDVSGSLREILLEWSA